MNIDIHTISSVFVYGGIASAFLIWIDTVKHPQSMKIMTSVWILTGLWASYLGLIAYFLIGRNSKKHTSLNMSSKMEMPAMNMNEMMDMKMPDSPKSPDPVKVGLSTLHCGAGCSLADLIGETLTIYLPLAFAGSLLAGQWILDYILALLIGILFQYAAIQPMMHLTPKEAIARAFKIDFWSLTFWQVGMYGWMAIVLFLLWPTGSLSKSSVEFWFMMQIAMLCGFLTAYPVNWVLIQKKIKPSM